jgi:hypothetical protein
MSRNCSRVYKIAVTVSDGYALSALPTRRYADSSAADTRAATGCCAGPSNITVNRAPGRAANVSCSAASFFQASSFW